LDELIRCLLISLALTEVLELAFCIIAWRLRGREIAICALVNVVTNPPVVLTYYMISQRLYACGEVGLLPLLIFALEVCAVAVEWLFYRRCTDKKHPFFLSLTANAFSYFAGLAISQLLLNRS